MLVEREDFCMNVIFLNSDRLDQRRLASSVPLGAENSRATLVVYAAVRDPRQANAAANSALVAALSVSRMLKDAGISAEFHDWRCSGKLFYSRSKGLEEFKPRLFNRCEKLIRFKLDQELPQISSKGISIVPLTVVNMTREGWFFQGIVAKRLPLDFAVRPLPKHL
jgi:hypothetical protein